MLKTLYQLSVGFVGVEGSQVNVLPKDVEGDATSGPQLIHLMQLSSSPSGPLMLSEVKERQGHRDCARLPMVFSLCACP